MPESDFPWLCWREEKKDTIINSFDKPLLKCLYVLGIHPWRRCNTELNATPASAHNQCVCWNRPPQAFRNQFGTSFPSSTLSDLLWVAWKGVHKWYIRASPPPESQLLNVIDQHTLPTKAQWRAPGSLSTHFQPLSPSFCVPTIRTFLSVKPTQCVTTIWPYVCLTAQAQDSAAWSFTSWPRQLCSLCA